MDIMALTTRPHAVFISFPLQSHMKGLMKLAKLLYNRGFYITFVNTEFNQNRLINANGPEKLEIFPDFKFETIPDGLPPSKPNASQDVYLLCKSIRRDFLNHFRQLLAKLNDGSRSTFPPPTCIVADGFMPFAVTAGKEFGIPVFLYYTIPACSYMGFYQYGALLEKGFTPLKDESYLTNGYLDTVIDWIPGIKEIRLRDLPSLFQTTDTTCEAFNLILESAQKVAEATGFGLHTFDALEPDVLQVLSTMFPRFYTIGPLQLLLNEAHNDQDSLGYDLWKVESECLDWLETKDPRSVLYVNFGSLTIMSHESLLEFAWGLANSKKSFLWIIRPDLVIGDAAILPSEFSEHIKERGFIASWCPQEEVLNHGSIGGFLTHCGWNSIIESLTAGVPMICWPYFADQPTNCRFVCNAWEVGMEIDSNVKRENVEKLIRELTEGEKGMKMKRKAMEWKKLAFEATSRDGSSSLNLDKLVNMLLSKD